MGPYLQPHIEGKGSDSESNNLQTMRQYSIVQYSIVQNSIV